MEASPIATIQLRNEHRVYKRADGNYFVESEDRHGAHHGQDVSSDVVDWLALNLAGAITNSERAADLLEWSADLDLPYTYGHKLRYFAQDVLLVLVATGRATMAQEGRGFTYRIRR